jgi:hypothetical protein
MRVVMRFLAVVVVALSAVCSSAAAAAAPSGFYEPRVLEPGRGAHFTSTL